MTITRPPDLSGALWPIHLKPLDDELLSSWMVRIARAFYIKPGVFWQRMIGPVSFRTIDYMGNTAVVQLLANRTLTPLTRATRTTLNDFQSRGLLREHLDRNVVAFCPLCLAAGIPYYRRSWCVTFVVSCSQHDTVLLNGCPSCKALIRFEKIPLVSESLALCRTCSSDLRTAKVATVPVDSRNLQQRLWRLLDDHSGQGPSRPPGLLPH